MLKGKFKVPIYGAKVEVRVGAPYDVITKLRWAYEDVERIKSCAGGVFRFGDGGYFCLIVRENMPIGRVISHEVHHLTDSILDWVGVRHAPCDETHAYLMGYLMDKVLKLINKGEKE